MSAYTTLLEEALEAWDGIRDGVIAEVENFTESELDFRPAPEMRSTTELVRHILESQLFAAGELTRSGGDFQRQEYTQLLAEYESGVNKLSGRSVLLAALRQTHESAREKFVAAGELHMLQFIRRFDGQLGTRLAWLYHASEHESYHRGQLALYARLVGKVPALTRLIYGLP